MSEQSASNFPFGAASAAGDDPFAAAKASAMKAAEELKAAATAKAKEIRHAAEQRAQEFRDVAGQMVNKIVAAALEIENILLEILKEYAPNTKDSLITTTGLTAGPGLKAKEQAQDQDDVDALLASMGL